MTHEEGVLCRPRGVIRFCIIYHVHRRYRRSSCPIEGVKYHIPVPEKEGVPSTFSQIPLLAVLMSPLTKMTLSYLGLRRDTGSGSTWATWALQFSLQFRRMSKIQPERNATRPMCIGDLCERGKGSPGQRVFSKGRHEHQDHTCRDMIRRQGIHLCRRESAATGMSATAKVIARYLTSSP